MNAPLPVNGWVRNIAAARKYREKCVFGTLPGEPFPAPENPDVGPRDRPGRESARRPGPVDQMASRLAEIWAVTVSIGAMPSTEVSLPWAR